MSLVEGAPAPINPEVQAAAAKALDQLNEHTLKTVHWHFSDDTGSPFWLEKKRNSTSTRSQM